MKIYFAKAQEGRLYVEVPDNEEINFANHSNYSMNDAIGSHHWFNTLMAHVLHIGEYMKDKGQITIELQTDWGVQLYNIAKDMFEWKEKSWLKPLPIPSRELPESAVPLLDLPPGELFTYDGCTALKSEYRTDKGACECYIVGSGEMFWGGTKTGEELNKLLVNHKKISM